MKCLGFVFHEREYEIFALHDAYLRLFVLVEIFGNDNVEFFILLDFTRVVGVENILHDEEIDAEVGADALYVSRVLQSAYLQPVNVAGTLHEGNEAFGFFLDVLVDVGGVVTEQVQLRGCHVLAAVAEAVGEEIVVVHLSVRYWFGSFRFEDTRYSRRICRNAVKYPYSDRKKHDNEQKNRVDCCF